MQVLKLISEKRVFILLLLISLVPVWVVPFFLTSDGPCHAWNARILYDMLHGNSGFYEPYYYLNAEPVPNWFSHAFLVGLYHFCDPVVAGKFLITAAIILWATGFRRLLLAFSPGNTWLSLWFLPFTWQAALLMGFYNYMLSLSCALWISAWFITSYRNFNWQKFILLSLSFVVLYFVHLFGCFLAFALCGLYLLFMENGVRQKAKQTGLLLLSALPSLLLIAWYIVVYGSRTNNSGRPPLGDLLSDLNNLSSLLGLTRSDVWNSMKMSFFLQLLILAGLVSFAFRKPKKEFLIPCLLSLIFLALYFFGYETTLGGSNIRPRLESLIYLFGLITISFARIPKLILIIASCTAVYFCISFSVGKIPAYRNASLFVSEIREASKYIKDKSLVLPLNLGHFLPGKDGVVINYHTLLFAHAAQAIPHNKQLIFMDNYEATTRYFPLTWKIDKDPFIHLAINEGIEAEPPQVDIPAYNSKVAPINYIVVWGKKEETWSNPLFSKTRQTLTDSYTLLYTSPVYKISVYELK